LFWGLVLEIAGHEVLAFALILGLFPPHYVAPFGLETCNFLLDTPPFRVELQVFTIFQGKIDFETYCPKA
jgi:hypothetical protein